MIRRGVKQRPLGRCWRCVIALRAATTVLAVAFGTAPLRAQVSVTVNAANSLAEMPEVGIGLHTSVYANIFGAGQLPAQIADSGVQMLRYPGGNYASIYHWTNHTATGGYAASASHFGNFVSRLLDGSGAKGMVTVNYGSSHGVTMGGQPKEAAAWVAYANGDASLFGTPDDIVIGVDAEGNDWRTAGYWARLRSLTPAENADNQYDFLAINRDEPVGIEYWEVGNELNGNGYYSDIDPNWNWQFDLHAPNPCGGNPNDPCGAGRGNHPALSPAAYANNFNEFAAAMKAVDPTIKVGAVLVGPGGVGDVADPNRNWDANVLPIAGENMDFGIIHFYSCCGTSAVLNSTDDLPGLFDTVRDRIDTYVGPGQSDRIELHMTEFGYFESVANPQIDGVYAANTYATALAEGVKSVHWLELSKDSFVGDNAGNLIHGGAYNGIQVFSRIAEAGSEFVETTSSSGSVEVHSLLLPDGRVGTLLANLNSSGTSTVNVDVSGIDLGPSGTTWLYGQNQTTPLETPLTSGLGNTFSVAVPFRSILAVLIDAAPAPVLAGDYNGDGTVDAADYATWRAGGPLLNETATPGIVDAADYDEWRANFGSASAGAGGLSGPAIARVPEPTALGLAKLWLVGALARRQFRAGTRRGMCSGIGTTAPPALPAV